MIIQELVRVEEDTNFDSALASMLSYLLISVIIKLLNALLIVVTLSRYLIIMGSRASYSPRTYLTISWESQ